MTPLKKIIKEWKRENPKDIIPEILLRQFCSKSYLDYIFSNETAGYVRWDEFIDLFYFQIENAHKMKSGVLIDKLYNKLNTLNEFIDMVNNQEQISTEEFMNYPEYKELNKLSISILSNHSLAKYKKKYPLKELGETITE